MSAAYFFMGCLLVGIQLGIVHEGILGRMRWIFFGSGVPLTLFIVDHAFYREPVPDFFTQAILNIAVGFIVVVLPSHYGNPDRLD